VQFGQAFIAAITACHRLLATHLEKDFLRWKNAGFFVLLSDLRN
jgi:hypothetical protein